MWHIQSTLQGRYNKTSIKVHQNYWNHNERKKINLKFMQTIISKLWIKLKKKNYQSCECPHQLSLVMIDCNHSYILYHMHFTIYKSIINITLNIMSFLSYLLMIIELHQSTIITSSGHDSRDAHVKVGVKGSCIHRTHLQPTFINPFP